MIALFIQLLMFISPIISVLTIAAKFHELRQAGSSRQWPSTSATIKKVTLVETTQKIQDKLLYQVQLELQYNVDGRVYQTIQPSFDAQGRHTGPKIWARESMARYRVDGQLPLFYNPKQPKQATLKAGHTAIDKTRWIMISGVMLLFSFLMCLFGTSALARTYLGIEGASGLAVGLLAFLITAALGGLIALLFTSEA